MNKRFLFILLAIVGGIAIVLVLWFILRPALPFVRQPAQQPPALPPRVETPFDPSRAVPTPPPPSDVPVDATSPEERERQAQEALKRQTMDFAARQGTYGSADGFDSLRELYPLVTTDLRAKLEDRRAQLLRDHPTFGAAWSQSIRSLSATIERASLPLDDRTNATVVVEAQQITDDAQTGRTTALVEVRVSFVKVNGVWIPSDVTLVPLNP
ncbi:hypothetical protein EDM68_04745 [Candidatus Uhrbacteria bacterium]|nr:MAG: hypothetical protein EDM68_04745 [Candidatus Uhrbacteria bacterium]